MRSVMISIQPKWCELIASGKKTVEVRKNRPKLETPFKVYIYCTKDEPLYHSGEKFWCEKAGEWGNGKVIGEFVCDFITNYEAELWDDETYERIQEFYEPEDFNEYGEYAYQTLADNSDDFWKEQHLCKVSCLSIEALRKYIGLGINKFYGWHISNLVIYDKPRKLSEFKRFCDGISGKIGCRGCKYYYEENDESQGHFEMCGCDNLRPLTRPPQSWCYVESEVTE